jgi:hypothetical protein
LGNITLTNHFVRHERHGDALDQMLLTIKQMRLESGVMSEDAFTPRDTKEQAKPDIEYDIALRPTILTHEAHTICSRNLLYSRRLEKVIADIELDLGLTRAIDNSERRHSDMDFALAIPHVHWASSLLSHSFQGGHFFADLHCATQIDINIKEKQTYFVLDVVEDNLRQLYDKQVGLLKALSSFSSRAAKLSPPRARAPIKCGPSSKPTCAWTKSA